MLGVLTAVRLPPVLLPLQRRSSRHVQCKLILRFSIQIVLKKSLVLPFTLKNLSF